MNSDLKFPHPWPAPQHLWADPPWILSGTSVTAWFEVSPKVVAGLVSPAFQSISGNKGVITRLRFYNINFEPRDGSADYKVQMSGTFKEAVIAFKGSFAGINGEFSAFMWTDDDTYISWGREIFGWPLIKNEITLFGRTWSSSTTDNTLCRVKSKDFDLSLSMDDASGVEQPIGDGPNWLTPRRVIFPAGIEPDRHDLNIVLPTILEAGKFSVHNGEVNFKVQENSIIAGLNPLTIPVIHSHANFKICVGDNVQTVQGIG